MTWFGQTTCDWSLAGERTARRERRGCTREGTCFPAPGRLYDGAPPEGTIGTVSHWTMRESRKGGILAPVNEKQRPFGGMAV